MNLEFLTTNLSATYRFETLENRQCVVCPMVMLTEGVHRGSSGDLYYSLNELKKNVAVWNHKPIVVYHPEIHGQPVSACIPEVLESRKIGIILNTICDDRLKAEAWIDIEKANKVDPRIIASIERNEMMELSTGVFTNNVMKAGTWNEEKYNGLATELGPDHLALLPDRVGACSIKDGAGFLRLNHSMDRGLVSHLSTLIANELENHSEGVWRTINGNRVFIKDGKYYDTYEDYEKGNASSKYKKGDENKTRATVKSKPQFSSKLPTKKSKKDEDEDDDVSDSREEDDKEEGGGWKSAAEGIREKLMRMAEEENKGKKKKGKGRGPTKNELIDNERSHEDIRSALQGLVREKYPKKDVWVVDVYDGHFIVDVGGEYLKWEYEATDTSTKLKSIPVEVHRVTSYVPSTLQERKDEAMTKKQIIDGLIANEAVPFSEEDRPTLDGMSEDFLAKLQPQPETNECKDCKDGKKCDKCKGMTKNEQQPPAPVVNTEKPVDKLDDLVANASPELRELVQDSIAVRNQERTDLVKIITANSSFSDVELAGMTQNQLRKMAASYQKTGTQQQTQPQGLYLGAQPFIPTANVDPTVNAVPPNAPPPLSLPTFNQKQSEKK